MADLKKITMECHEGNSNKDYSIWIEKKADGYIVPFLFGAIGGTKQSGCKTPKPVSLEDAEKALEKVVKEKLAKGYVAGGNVPAYTQVEGAVDSGIRPMLLTDCSDEGPDRFIEDDAWAGQEKMNGKRIMVKIDGGNVTGSNKRGLVCPIPEAVVAELAQKKIDIAVLDGELIGDVYHAFDLLQLVGDMREARFGKRHDVLSVFFKDTDHVRVVPRVFGKAEKLRLVKKLQESRKEGVVFKLLGGRYTPGKIENVKKAIAVKVKFWNEGDFVIEGWNGDKMSVKVQAWGKGEDHGSHYDTFEPVDVGNVTIPAKYKKQIGPGKILRVKYLFATDANQLYQPKVDPTDDGQIVREKDWDGRITKVADLKHEGKDE